MSFLYDVQWTKDDLLNLLIVQRFIQRECVFSWKPVITAAWEPLIITLTHAEHLLLALNFPVGKKMLHELFKSLIIFQNLFDIYLEVAGLVRAALDEYKLPVRERSVSKQSSRNIYTSARGPGIPCCCAFLRAFLRRTQFTEWWVKHNVMTGPIVHNNND